MKKKCGLKINHVDEFHVVFIGAGGIFSELEVPLAEILRGLLPVEWMNPSATVEEKFSKVFTRKIRVTIVDGDRFEPGNEYRQNITSSQYGKFKAEYFARKLSNKINYDVYFVNRYIYNKNDLINILQKQKNSLPILVGCCDNDAARKVMHGACNKMDNVIWIDGGCGKYSGQVVCGIRGNNRLLFPLITDLYPTILKSSIKEQKKTHSLQNGGTCSRVTTIDSRNFNQTVISNMYAAVHIISFLNDILMGNELTVNSVDFNAQRYLSAPTCIDFNSAKSASRKTR